MYIREPPRVLAALRIHEFRIRDETLSLDAGSSVAILTVVILCFGHYDYRQLFCTCEIIITQYVYRNRELSKIAYYLVGKLNFSFSRHEIVHVI